ncbi:2'-5' RNA ligase family protein [Streptomyces lunaelactis]|uniref:2'-5' RNA ligase family protein n=1 Tax=Streptomyces lunaelactis TaxID=1535768 RepID=UPI002815E2CB|nr:2'-5' RNA ligase family protein [Streptomyces lunaelactis]
MTVRLMPHPASFPADPPPDPDSAWAVATHDWHAFDEVTSMVNHWDRPSWRPGRRAVYWLITFSTPLLIDHARQCQEAIRHLGFDAIGMRSLHLTLGRIGLSDALSRSQLTSLAAAVRRYCLPPEFPLSAIPMTASRGAVRYSVAPWTPVITLHARLARASNTIGLPPMGGSRFVRPHLGIAYCNRSLPASEVRAAVEPLRLLPPVPLLVDRVQMVEMWRVEGAYHWQVLEEILLPTG